MIQTLDDIIPGLVEKGQFVALELAKLTNNVNSKHFEKISSLPKGMITGMVCNDAQTLQAHTEKDCAYTLCGIPFGEENVNKQGIFVFEFSWGPGRIIRVKHVPGTVLYYTGYGIMHRQFSLEKPGDKCPNFNFWNINTYGGKNSMKG